MFRSVFTACLMLGVLVTGCGDLESNNTAQTDSVMASELGNEEQGFALSAGQTINLAEAKACRVAQVDGVQLYMGSLKLSDCITKCGEFETTNPGRSCTFNGGAFRSAPTNICQIIGAGGVVRFSAQTIRKSCAQECTKYANPGRTCIWGGQSVKQ